MKKRREVRYVKLDIKACGFAAAIIYAAVAVLLGWAAAWLNWGNGMVEMLGSFYIGYAATFVGAIIGGIWTFVDGFICGAVFAWLYNKLAR